MQKKRNLIWTITLIISLAITSCQTDLDMIDIIDQKSAFTLTIRVIDLETGLSSNKTEEIKINSEKWTKLIDFAKKIKTDGNQILHHTLVTYMYLKGTLN